LILTDNLVTIWEMEMDSVIGHFPEMKTVDAALKHTLGLD
jgi:hypothetical protein